MIDLEKNDKSTESVILRGFKYYKRHRRYGKKDLKIDSIIDKLICIYFGVGHNDTHFDNMKKSFVDKYIRNETSVEGINYLTRHGREELIGLWQMYEYIHSDDVEYKFDIFTIKDLHEKLYSCSKYPEFGGLFRRGFAYLLGCSADVCDWRYIFRSLKDLNVEVKILRASALEVRNNCSPKLLLDYIDRCVELNCRLVRIHPFSDGNGRTIRCFTNKLFEDAGLPPVYINAAERDEYLEAMSRAMGAEDYSLIKKFYKYKICDSIFELDIVDRLKQKDISESQNSTILQKTIER